MQTSGFVGRENANAHSVVIAREGGRPSIPETLMIEPIGRGVLDPPPSRGTTWGDLVGFVVADAAP